MNMQDPNAVATKPESDTEDAPERLEFKPPKGANLPETAADGKEFDVVCSFKLDGETLTMTKFGETAMPGYGAKDKAKKEDAPDPHYAGFTQGMQAGPEDASAGMA